MNKIAWPNLFTSKYLIRYIIQEYMEGIGLRQVTLRFTLIKQHDGYNNHFYNFVPYLQNKYQRTTKQIDVPIGQHKIFISFFSKKVEDKSNPHNWQFYFKINNVKHLYQDPQLFLTISTWYQKNPKDKDKDQVKIKFEDQEKPYLLLTEKYYQKGFQLQKQDKIKFGTVVTQVRQLITKPPTVILIEEFTPYEEILELKNGELILGRNEEQQKKTIFNHVDVSREQARLWFEDEKFYLQDHQSKSMFGTHAQCSQLPYNIIQEPLGITIGTIFVQVRVLEKSQ